jgi:hypothetical protein
VFVDVDSFPNSSTTILRSTFFINSRYSRKRIIEALKRYFTETGYPMSHVFLGNSLLINSKVYQRRVGRPRKLGYVAAACGHVSHFC